MDYFNLLTMQARQANISAVVLNSVTNLEKAVPFLSGHSNQRIFRQRWSGTTGDEKTTKLEFTRRGYFQKIRRIQRRERLFVRKKDGNPANKTKT